jgi:hypothetical protein
MAECGGDKNLPAKLLEEMQQAELTYTQIELLNGFYAGRREAVGRNRIPHSTLERIASGVGYESDLAVSIFQQLDDYLISLIYEKERKDHEKAMAKSGRR